MTNRGGKLQPLLSIVVCRTDCRRMRGDAANLETTEARLRCTTAKEEEGKRKGVLT